MRVIIEHDDKKIGFDGPFNILLDTQSFWSLWGAMRKQRKQMKKRGTRFTYGWISVPLWQPRIPNTKAADWNE